MIMNSIWSGAFWKAAAERAISTAAQAALAYLPVSQFTVIGFDWLALGGIAAGGAVLSLLKSLVANAATGTGPSLVNSEQTVPPATDPGTYGPGEGDLDPIDRDSR